MSLGEPTVSREDFREHLAAREFFANRLEAYFKAHPGEWISLFDLMKIGGPSWRSRIACDLRKKRGLNIVWNKSNLASAYRYLDHTPLGRPADVPVPDRWPVFDGPIQETFRLTSE
jgi:hypothetical protein